MIWFFLLTVKAASSAPLDAPKHKVFEQYEFLEILQVGEATEEGLHPHGRTGSHRRTGSAGEAGQRDGWLQVYDHAVKAMAFGRWNHFLQLVSEKAFPSGHLPDFEDPKALGAGSFAITYKATYKPTGQVVAVKVFKDSAGLWITASDYGKYENNARIINMSRTECVNLQEIQQPQSQSKDPTGSSHVTKCIYDGITIPLQGGEEFENVPLHIVLEFGGTDDLDKWWGKQLKLKKANSDYVKLMKKATKGMLEGLRFLSESPGDVQWVHHDLKPQNMVVNDQTAEVVVVDMGTALSTKNETAKSACTPFFRPPSFDHYGVFESEVGFHPPVWSYDIYSAALSIFGMSLDGDFSSVKGLDGLSAIPVYPLMLYVSVQNSLASMSALKQIQKCVGQRPNKLWSCTEKLFRDAWIQEHDKGIKKIQESSGDARKAALAAVVNCRRWKGNPGEFILQPFPGELPPTHTADFFWTLADDWMATGFDELLVKMVSSNPQERPRPSEVLESNWFKTDSVTEQGKPVEYTCPEMPVADFAVLSSMFTVVHVFSCLTCCVCYGGTCLTASRLAVEAWKWSMAWGGLLMLLSPFVARMTTDLAILWMILMMPCGLALMVGACKSLPADKETKVKSILVASAVLLDLLFVIVTRYSTQIVMDLALVITKHSNVVIQALSLVAVPFAMYFMWIFTLLPILALLCGCISLASLNAPGGPREMTQPGMPGSPSF